MYFVKQVSLIAIKKKNGRGKVRKVVKEEDASLCAGVHTLPWALGEVSTQATLQLLLLPQRDNLKQSSHRCERDRRGGWEGSFIPCTCFQKQLDDRQNRKLAGGKGNTETTTVQGAGISHTQTLSLTQPPSFQILAGIVY